jgi:hypothetical protein
LGSGHAASEEEEIHACLDENGNIVYQNDSCPEIPEKKAAPSAPVPKRATPTAPSTVRPTQSSWQKVPPRRRALPVPERRIAKQTFPTSLDGAAQADPSFASPGQTWRTFLAAIESGDRSAAVACLTPAALERLGPDAESFPLGELRETVRAFIRIEDEGDTGPFWSIYGVRATQRPKWIFFERTDDGKWKIASI